MSHAFRLAKQYRGSFLCPIRTLDSIGISLSEGEIFLQTREQKLFPIKSIVKPVYKALRVLECLGEAQQELSLTEISQRVRLPKTTVFRYL